MNGSNPCRFCTASCFTTKLERILHSSSIRCAVSFTFSESLHKVHLCMNAVVKKTKPVSEPRNGGKSLEAVGQGANAGPAGEFVMGRTISPWEPALEGRGGEDGYVNPATP